MRMQKPKGSVVEATYNPAGDVLQLWYADPRGPTLNRALGDEGESLFAIVRLDDRDKIIGYEITSFHHYVSLHTDLLPLADALDRLPGASVIWGSPAPIAGLEKLIPAHVEALDPDWTAPKLRLPG